MSGFVQSLTVYPLKSAAGIAVDSFDCTPRGPQHDRRWMIVDERGQFVTQRTDPSLARVRPEIESKKVIAHLPNASVELPILAGGGDRSVRVWRSELMACDVGDHVARAFSDFLGRRVRVVYMSDDNSRFTNPDVAADQLVSFADGYPYLLTNTASLADLNERAGGTSLGMKRFRPNIVVSGVDPWGEDDWDTVRIGEANFRLVKPCARCSMTTVDPNTGEFEGPEPLKTLATFRRQDGEVMFGWNAIGPEKATISVGDPVEVG